MLALEINNLKKTYPNDLEALKGINLNVEEGDFYALLGPNGAGKSTTIGIITSLINKTGGTVKVFGHDIDTDLAKAKQQIGLVPQEFNFNIFETCMQILVCQAGFYGVKASIAYKRAEYYLEKLGLWSSRNKRARLLSGGMKRRLMIARALVHEPRLLILDEPTAGVDIEIRRTMWDFMKEMNAKGTTIILTTHYLEEAETLCRNITIIDKGRVIEATNMKSLLQKLHLQTFILDLKDPLRGIALHSDFLWEVIDAQTLSVCIKNGQSLNDVFSVLSAQGIMVSSMKNKANRLEELFLNLTSTEAK